MNTIQCLVNQHEIHDEIHEEIDGKQCRDILLHNKLWIREFYVNDSLNGPRTVYYPDGQRKIEESYVDGKREGERKTWHSNGKLASLEYYINGELEGKLQTWNADGNDISEIYYKNGQKHGFSKWRYENGKMSSASWYQNGKEKEYRTWYANGIPSIVTRYPDKFCHGRDKCWRENGQIYKKASTPGGECKYWDQDGKPVIYYVDKRKITRNFGVAGLVFRKLKICLYFRIKKKSLNSFLISDLNISVINMIRI
jgi:antitoxin component YwqK of YwqJK toxin-antitoxin module